MEPLSFANETKAILAQQQTSNACLPSFPRDISLSEEAFYLLRIVDVFFLPQGKYKVNEFKRTRVRLTRLPFALCCTAQRHGAISMI